MNCQMFSWPLSSGARGGSGTSEALLGTISALAPCAMVLVDAAYGHDSKPRAGVTELEKVYDAAFSRRAGCRHAARPDGNRQ
jgi:hypothetical protein